ncbi:MAG: PHB depolymerase family esterase [Steroidobacteraceae bacterium]|jgi:poly(hydroxyalkanoate) depolymerase family esterase
MLRSLRRFLMKKFVARVPRAARSGETGRSRFLVGHFKDPRASAVRSLGTAGALAYRLYLPAGSSRRDSMPLIVMLHGCKQDSLSFAEGTRMNMLAEEYRCAVLYPEQSPRSNPLRCWNWFESTSLAGQGEAALIAHLIDQVTQRRPIDPRRVYVVGMSAGGAMACLLAVRYSRLFAACAIHSGVMYGAASSPAQALALMRDGPSPSSIERAWQLVCDASEFAAIVPTIVIHGDRDMTVNPVNADQIIAQLKARVEELADPRAGPLLAHDERRIESGGHTYRQQDSTRTGELVLRRIVVEGLGHAWSGGNMNYEFNDSNGPDASRFILDFVMAYRTQRAAPPIYRSS